MMIYIITFLTSIALIALGLMFDKKSMIDENIFYQAGDKIIHDNYGEGIIVAVDKSVLTVAFPHPVGIKKLIKGHITFRKVE